MACYRVCKYSKGAGFNKDILGGLLQHVITVPAGDGDEGDSLGVVADLLDEGRSFLDNFVETVLTPLQLKRKQMLWR